MAADRSQLHLQGEPLEQAKAKALATRAEGWSIAYCASQVGVCRNTIMHWAETDPVFAAKWREANEAHLDWHEDVLRKSAASGQFVPSLAVLKSAGRIVEKSAVDTGALAAELLLQMRGLAAQQRQALPATPLAIEPSSATPDSADSPDSAQSAPPDSASAT